MEQGAAEARPVTVADMAAARERRAARLAALGANGATVVSLLLNVPGACKRSLLFDRAFAEGRDLVERHIAALGWGGLLVEDEALFTGMETRWALKAHAPAVKRALCALEESHPLGRFWDLDVSVGGVSLSREAFGFPERGCMLCGAPGRECARARRHSAAELAAFMQARIAEYFERRAADALAALAARALTCEVCASPKPGLVDRCNSGAHSDMGLYDFLASAAVLTPYFRDCALIGASTRSLPAAGVLERLRPGGLLAEARMLAATGGVNTHRGAIYSMGILCAALGRLPENAAKRDEAAALTLCAEIAAADTPPNNLCTHGARAKRRYGAGGVRAEAAAGFPSVAEHGLPALREALDAGASLEEAAACALLALIAAVEDTNLITRVGYKRAGELREQTRALLSASPAILERLAAAAVLDTQFIAENASPGGCADLLALTLLLHFWQSDKKPETTA